jgi:hypothetical protein
MVTTTKTIAVTRQGVGPLVDPLQIKDCTRFHKPFLIKKPIYYSKVIVTMERYTRLMTYIYRNKEQKMAFEMPN